MQSMKLCSNCGAEGHFTACAGCKQVVYCSQGCLKADWPSHRDLCGAFNDPSFKPDANPSPKHRPLYRYLSHALRPSRPRLCKAALQTIIAELPNHCEDPTLLSLLLLHLWLYTGAGIPAYLHRRLVTTLEQLIPRGQFIAGAHSTDRVAFQLMVAVSLHLLRSDSTFAAAGCRFGEAGADVARRAGNFSVMSHTMHAAMEYLAWIKVPFSVTKLSRACNRLVCLPQQVQQGLVSRNIKQLCVGPNCHIRCTFLLRGAGLVAGPLRLVARAETDTLVRLWASNAPAADKGAACHFDAVTVQPPGGVDRSFSLATAHKRIHLPKGSTEGMKKVLMTPLAPDMWDHLLSAAAREVDAGKAASTDKRCFADIVEAAKEEVKRLVPPSALPSDRGLDSIWMDTFLLDK